MDRGDWWATVHGVSGGLQFTGLQRVGHDLATKPPPHLSREVEKDRSFLAIVAEKRLLKRQGIM